MIKVTLSGNWNPFDNLAKQIPFAAAKALTKTAQKIQRAILAALEGELDRPNEFTKRGTYIKPATKTNLVAEVGFKDKQARYMRLQIEGGTRKAGPRGIKLPGNVQLDQYGNIPKGLINKLIASARSGKMGAGVRRKLGINGRGKAPSDLSLFYGQPANHPDMPVGIYRRTPQGLIPIVVFSGKSARYKPRFKFRNLAERVVAATFQAEFDAAVADAIRTAR